MTAVSHFHLWVQGARPRTLPASLAPVVIGACCAWKSLRGWQSEHFWAVVCLAACVALFLQIAVNYANDYSDGIRGTDKRRGASERQTGLPTRLTASGVVSPRAVLTMACVWAVAVCGAGIALAILSGHLWLIALGAVCLAAAWFYTGGSHPYGYVGFGEVSVFVFFGLIAVLGTQYAAAGLVSVPGIIGACAAGFDSAAILVVNNIRDIAGDKQSGKNTIEVRLGARRSQWLLSALLIMGAGLGLTDAFLLSAQPCPLWIIALWMLAVGCAAFTAAKSAHGHHRAALMGASANVFLLSLLVFCALYT